jgi:hypothetical protein
MRLSLNIPESPIEKQAFRSRSFRRIVLAACTLSLFLATIHSIHVKTDLDRQLAREYLNFRRSSNLNPLQHSLPVGKLQIPLEALGNGPHATDDLMKHLPEVIRIPFEEAVEDVELQGWEDAWFASATFDYSTQFTEPKLDFVYNCESGIK